MIQTKKNCACGGGCPKCNKKQYSSSERLQTKLQIGNPNDIYEQEADKIADQVMAVSPHASISDVPARIQRLPRTQIKQGNFSAPASVDQVLSNSGRPLESSLVQDMEQRFEKDFSHVRIHTGAAAEKSAKDIHAHAYTMGNNIVFGAGQFAPNSQAGKRLLAHELTHVVQQRGQTSETGLRIQRQDDGGTAATVDEVCKALRTQLENSGRVIALYHEFLAGNVTWEEMQSQIRMVGNAAQGVTGAGLDLPQVVQDAIAEVESLGLEEIQQGGALLWELIAGDTESFHTQWVRNEIERQQHLNRVLIEAMYSHGCPDFPGTWDAYQEQVLSIGTRGNEAPSTGVGVPLETRTAVAWVRIGEEEVLVLATEVAGSGRLRFVRWIDSEFRDLSIEQAEEKQGSIPAVPGTAVTGLPSTVPGSAARR